MKLLRSVLSLRVACKVLQIICRYDKLTIAG